MVAGLVLSQVSFLSNESFFDIYPRGCWSLTEVTHPKQESPLDYFVIKQNIWLTLGQGKWTTWHLFCSSGTFITTQRNIDPLLPDLFLVGHLGHRVWVATHIFRGVVDNWHDSTNSIVLVNMNEAKNCNITYLLNTKIIIDKFRLYYLKFSRRKEEAL